MLAFSNTIFNPVVCVLLKMHIANGKLYIFIVISMGHANLNFKP